MIDEIITAIDYINTHTDQLISFPVFIQLTISVILMIFFRTFNFCKTEGVDLFSKDLSAGLRRKQRYIIGHCAIEFLLAYLIGYLLILLRGSTSMRIIWNSLLAPGTGVVLGIAIDQKWLLDLTKFAPADSSTIHDDSAPSVTVQIDDEQEVDGMVDVEPNTTQLSKHLPEALADHVDFREKIIDSINQMKDVQNIHDHNINKLRERCDGIADTLDRMQQAERDQYGITLKRKMYKCLGKGFATPQEYEEIEVEYDIYHNLLGGNGTIERLHDNKFSTLEVHEDSKLRMKSALDEAAPLCYYGEYDNED